MKKYDIFFISVMMFMLGYGAGVISERIATDKIKQQNSNILHEQLKNDIPLTPLDIIIK